MFEIITLLIIVIAIALDLFVLSAGGDSRHFETGQWPSRSNVCVLSDSSTSAG